MTRVLLLLIAIVASNLPDTGGQEQARFATRATAVILDVSVTDGERPVLGLTRDDFIVLDNGVPQEIQDLTHERLPTDVHVTADISGSMSTADRQIVNRAIGQIGDALSAQDRMSATLFWSHVSERVPLGQPPVTLTASDTGHNTAILDAMLLALVRPDLPERRQFSIFMSDGVDTASYFDADAVLATARHAVGPMTVVLAPDRAPRLMADILGAVALQTGGEVITLEDRSQLRETLSRALESFRSSYVVRYFPTGVEAGGWHSVSVSVKEGRYAVRARKGYSATQPPTGGRSREVTR